MLQRKIGEYYKETSEKYYSQNLARNKKVSLKI